MSEKEKYRQEFLLKMYEQLCLENNRNIGFVVQSVSVLIAAFAVLALTEKGIINLDFACLLIILICTWFLRLVIDSNYWYNRNLSMITNIEKEFLLNSDLVDIHYYFGGKRGGKSVLTNFKAQIYLGAGIAVSVVTYHFFVRIINDFNQDWGDLGITRLLPYFAMIWSIYTLNDLQKTQNEKYKEFNDNSPGKEKDYKNNLFDINSINYGKGHPLE